MKKNGFVMSTYVYMLLVFFLLLLTTMLTVLNNTKLLSNKLRNDTAISSGLLDKNFSFILLGDKEVTLFKNDEYIDPGFIAKTNNGKELEENVKITGEVNNTEVGEYTITYKLTYNGISKELKRKVIVVDGFTYYINSLLDTEKGNTDGLKRTTAIYNGITYDAGIRYTGSNPNNYVSFNCDDDGSNCETWRIIGVFDVDGEKRLKIINTASSFKALWDADTENNNGYGINQWFPSRYEDGNEYKGADLYQLLNGFYIGKSGSECIYYVTSNKLEAMEQECTAATLTNANMKPLTSSAKSMISNAKWYTYGVSSDDLRSITSANVDKAYLQEMGISTQYTGKKCSSGSYCDDTVVRTTSGTALIGLASATDIAYADGWLYNRAMVWSITADSDLSYASDVWVATSSSLNNENHTLTPYSIFPTVYLNFNVKNLDGNGTSEKPYKLGI